MQMASRAYPPLLPPANGAAAAAVPTTAGVEASQAVTTGLDDAQREHRLYKVHQRAQGAVTGPEAAAARVRRNGLEQEEVQAVYPGAPSAVQLQLAAMQQTLQPLQNGQQQLLQGLQQLNIKIDRAEIRRRNATAFTAESILQPVPDDQGNYPGVFPATRGALGGLTAAQMNLMLAAYGLGQAGNVAAKRQRLGDHIGIVGIV